MRCAKQPRSHHRAFRCGTCSLHRSHGSRSPSGKYTVQVQEGQEFRLLVHDCQTAGIDGCLSPSGWGHGFGAFGGIELGRWLLADCLGDAYLTNSSETAMSERPEAHFRARATCPPGQ
jgi:hypothetical protein